MEYPEDKVTTNLSKFKRPKVKPWDDGHKVSFSSAESTKFDSNPEIWIKINWAAETKTLQNPCADTWRFV